MGHLVRAAQQLIDELDAVAPKAEVKVLDEVDGLGFNRTIRIDAAGAKALGDAAEALLADDRIDDIVKSSQGLKVTFVADSRADFATPYGLAEVVATESE